jgi:hypothetical protein
MPEPNLQLDYLLGSLRAEDILLFSKASQLLAPLTNISVVVTSDNILQHLFPADYRHAPEFEPRLCVFEA